LKSKLFIIGGLIFATLFIACKKNPSTIGLNIHPDSDKIKTFVLEMNNLKAYSFSEDSLSTDKRSTALLGAINDPIFGFSEASFITQARLSALNVNFGTNPVADSIILYLDYKSFYGDTSTQQSIQIFELTKSISFDSVYYSNMDPSPYFDENTPLANFEYYPKPNDTMLVIKLNKDFAEKLITANSSVYETNENFIDFFKGLYLRVNPNSNTNNAIIYFNLLTVKSKLKIFYTNSSGNQSFDYVINNNCARINLFKNVFPNDNSISYNDTNSTDTLLYIKSMAGLAVKMFFPGINSLIDSGRIVISKAELIIPVHYDFSNETFNEPHRLLLLGFKEDGSYEFTADYSVGENYYDGTYNKETKEYKFNMARHIQRLVDGAQIDRGVGIIAIENRVTANRVVLKSPLAANGAKLKIYYFKI